MHQPFFESEGRTVSLCYYIIPILLDEVYISGMVGGAVEGLITEGAVQRRQHQKLGLIVTTTASNQSDKNDKYYIEFYLKNDNQK